MKGINSKNRNSGVKVLKKHENNITGIRVELTQKMTASGKIIHAVVVTNMRRDRRILVKSYDAIMDAFRMYKKALA